MVVVAKTVIDVPIRPKDPHTTYDPPTGHVHMTRHMTTRPMRCVAWNVTRSVTGGAMPLPDLRSMLWWSVLRPGTRRPMLR